MSDEGRGKSRGRPERFQARPPEAGEDQRNERKLRKMASGTAGPANALGLGRRQPVGRPDQLFGVMGTAGQAEANVKFGKHFLFVSRHIDGSSSQHGIEGCPGEVVFQRQHPL